MSENKDSNGHAESGLLAGQGCKSTKSRKLIIEILEKAEKPLSAEEIFLRIKEMGRSVNLSTVYRNLELIESKELVNKTRMGDGKAIYELTGSGHRHHLICTACHRSVPIDICPLETLQRDVGKKTQFDITGHKLELYGICPECKENNNL